LVGERLLECFDTALRAVRNSREPLFSSLLQHLYLLTIALNRRRQAIGANSIGHIEQRAPTLLCISGILFRNRLAATRDRSLELILELPCIRSRQRFDRVEGCTQFGELLCAFEQLRTRQMSDSLQRLDQAEGVRLVRIQCRGLVRELLFAPIENSIAVL